MSFMSSAIGSFGERLVFSENSISVFPKLLSPQPTPRVFKENRIFFFSRKHGTLLKL
jgi:hypothetical protein